jgi:hypothetical protein
MAITFRRIGSFVRFRAAVLVTVAFLFSSCSMRIQSQSPQDKYFTNPKFKRSIVTPSEQRKMLASFVIGFAISSTINTGPNSKIAKIVDKLFD